MRGIIRRVLAPAVLLAGCAVGSAWAAPVYLLVEGPMAAVAEGEFEAGARAETGRSGYDELETRFIRGATEVSESYVSSSASAQELPVSGGTASVTAGAGGDAAAVEITLTGNKSSADGLPLFAFASEWQTYDVEDATLPVGTIVSVNMAYLLELSLSSVDLNHIVSVQTHLEVFEGTATRGPDELGVADAYEFDGLYGSTLSYNSSTGSPELDVFQSDEGVATLGMKVGSSYLVTLWTIAFVDAGSAGLTVSGFSDPTFTCASELCANTSIIRHAVTPVAEPSALALTAFALMGLIAVRTRRQLSHLDR